MCLHLRRWFLSSVLVNRKKNIMSLPELSLFSRHRLQPLWFLPYANRADRLPKHHCVVPHRPLLFSNPYKTAWHQTTFSIQCWEKKKKKKKNHGYIPQNRLYSQSFNQSFQGISESELMSKAQHVWHQPVRFSQWFLSARLCFLYLMYSHRC